MASSKTLANLSIDYLEVFMLTLTLLLLLLSRMRRISTAPRNHPSIDQ